MSIYLSISFCGTKEKYICDVESRDALNNIPCLSIRRLNDRNAQVRIVVDDENDHAPEFTLSAYEGRIMENSPAGTEVTLTNPIAASDKDQGENRNFVFALRGEGSGLFRIDSTTGRVYFEGIDDRTLDRESRASYEFQIIATDSGECRKSPPNFTLRVSSTTMTYETYEGR